MSIFFPAYTDTRHLDTPWIPLHLISLSHLNHRILSDLHILFLSPLLHTFTPFFPSCLRYFLPFVLHVIDFFATLISSSPHSFPMTPPAHLHSFLPFQPPLTFPFCLVCNWFLVLASYADYFYRSRNKNQTFVIPFSFFFFLLWL